MSKYVMGLDLGTTSAKACIFNRVGHLVAEAEELVLSEYPKVGWVQQDAAAIERSAVLAVKNVVQKAGIAKDEIAVIGFSAAMHSLVPVSEEGMPLSPAFIWSDGRGTDQVDRLTEVERQQFYTRTGTPVHPMTPFMKLLWMKETGFEPYHQAAYFMSIKEYLIYCWFGKRVIDYSMASATGLFNPSVLEWDKDILELAGIRAAQLSEIVAPTTLLGTIKEEIAAEMGIASAVPVAIGAADGQLANLGIGALLPGEVAVSVGTSGAIRQVTNEAKVSSRGETFCYSFTEDSYIIGGPTNNGGIALQWLKQLLNDQGSYESFLAEAGQSAPGAEGLLFLPYINGERAPLWNQRARGNFYGMTVAHTKAHYVRAVLEGITFNLYQIGRALEQLAGPSRKIYVNGGLARSPIWLQMMADIFDAEIYVSENHHSAAWGAAWIGLVAIGEEKDLASIKQNIPMGQAVLPNQENSLVYKAVYERYEKLAASIAALFE
ncbi:gluconokinase [Paenibacillus glycanilyticus]|uniref:gluconokinase n=1 Tax=Paenibacillus glycanilyticus TaxID=126569 RepID=UPI00203C2007|nr:gluconokinase [Paenibacillus glycanilyticus]MCM3626870.1 gluconokinase [Paenibacillus glycanilyticus]